MWFVPDLRWYLQHGVLVSGQESDLHGLPPHNTTVKGALK